MKTDFEKFNYMSCKIAAIAMYNNNNNLWKGQKLNIYKFQNINGNCNFLFYL